MVRFLESRSPKNNPSYNLRFDLLSVDCERGKMKIYETPGESLPLLVLRH